MRLPGLSQTTSLTHPDLEVTKHQAECRTRTLYCVGGLGPEVNLRINNPDVTTLATALLTRMYYYEVDGEFIMPPRPDAKFVFDTLKEFRSKVFRFSATPVSLDSVVEMYKGRKKTIYANARDSLGENAVCRADSISRCFVKCEKVNPTKAPRCIQPRDPRYNLEVAAYLKPLEHRIYKKIDRLFGSPTIMKGYNVVDVGRIFAAKWHRFNRPVGIGIDAMKFDMSVSPEMLAWEHSCYLRIYRGDEHLKKLLSWQMDNRGRGYCEDGVLKYKVKGKRFSGDINTALGNCLLMCAMVWTYLQYKDIDAELMNNGDDCMIIMEKENEGGFMDGFKEWFLNLGFRMTCEPPVYNLPEAEFCQMRCIRTVNGPIMVRNIPIALAKDTMCTLGLANENAMRTWLGAVGKCGMAITKGVPVLNSFYASYLRNGEVRGKLDTANGFLTGIHMMSVGVDLDSDEISADAREDCYIAWGILPDHQTALEEEYSQAVIEWSLDECDDHSAYDHKLL